MLAGLMIGLGLLRAAEMSPHLRLRREVSPDDLGLPSNATSIRESISTSFSCDGRTYGYYADPDNDCQVFHVCLPVHFDDGEEQTFKWSFICPQETVFNQETFTCAREEDAVACEDSALFYSLNDRFGQPNTLPPPTESTDEVPPLESNILIN
ncbi:uncharacterized protein LOC128998741 [Macrosteles quadrilineatus]|uniref:uncharacterized protein LOC128998741 n=1 Tax=Macrosteles quadrilineatus TaxID=74068 RepID=UPI0023E2F2EA|nr:uncharacterized protein LOC128998741 [Macrosteles quadrilineatus]